MSKNIVEPINNNKNKLNCEIIYNFYLHSNKWHDIAYLTNTIHYILTFKVHKFQIQHTIFFFSNKTHDFVCSIYANFLISIFNEHNFLCNVHKFLYLMYSISHFCTFNVHKFLKNLYNSIQSMDANFQILYPILHIPSTQFFKKCTQFYMFNAHKLLSNKHNFVHLTYTNFQKMYTIIHI